MIFLDEFHPKCEITIIARRLLMRVVNRVKKNKHGKVDLDDHDMDPSILKCKYDKEEDSCLV